MATPRRGPLLIDSLQSLDLLEVELLTDFQLQVEFAFDAAVTEEDHSYSSHAPTPGAVLRAYRRLSGEPPQVWSPAIRSHVFDLGEALSPDAAANLAAARTCLLEWLAHAAEKRPAECADTRFSRA